MMKLNIDAGNDLVLIAKDDIRMITSTPEGVWLYYKNSESGTLITSNTIEPTELFKKVARAVACEPDELESFSKKCAGKVSIKDNSFCHIQDMQGHFVSDKTGSQPKVHSPCEQAGHIKPEPFKEQLKTPKIHRGNLNDEELAAWLKYVAKDLESVSAREEMIPTLTQDLQDAKERLSATQLRIKEAFYQQAQDPIQNHGTYDNHQ